MNLLKCDLKITIMTAKYKITGMSCAACQMHIEKAVNRISGVNSVNVSLLTNSMTVEGKAVDTEIIKAVKDAGYGAVPVSVSTDNRNGNAPDPVMKPELDLQDTETPVLVRRLISSVLILIVIMYFGMGHSMLNLPIPSLFYIPAAMGLLEMLLTILVIIINRRFFISGFNALLHGSANMDTLVAMGSGAAFFYSVGALFLVISAMEQGDTGRVTDLSTRCFYFESAAMILTLITFGKTLEAYSKGRTTDALKSLMNLAPKTANIERDGKIFEAEISDVKIDDIFIVRPGESIPVDGIIIDGLTAVNEAALTGESIPRDKAPGDTVSAGTINTSGFIKARAVRVGADTTLSGIIQLVSDASSTKAPIGRIADKISGIFCPAVIFISLFTFASWLILGKTFGFAFSRAISILVISCPCALGLATPVAIMVGSGVGAKNGILFKTAAALEEAGKTEIIALDKTGTITTGEPSVMDIIPAEEITEKDLLCTAASLESKSEHPLSKAVLSHAKESGIDISTITEFVAIPGKGLTAKLNGNRIYGGNYYYISEHAHVTDELKEIADNLAGSGRTPLYFARESTLLGIISVADSVKEESASAVQRLRNMGLQVVMLTGDNKETANAIGQDAGIEYIVADILPEGKGNTIQKLRKNGKVAMVGDGINDAPALTIADTGIAIGAGTDVAIDAATIILVKSRLTDVPAAICLSRAVIKNIHENLFWAFFYNLICIPLAAGFYQALFHWNYEMNPMIGAMAMSLSSATVCLNALRLNLFRLYDPVNDRKSFVIKKNNINIEPEEVEMTKTIKISGMMCEHCEMNVKKALEAIEGVSSARVSHSDGTAVVELSSDVSDDVLKKAVEDKDYTVNSIL